MLRLKKMGSIWQCLPVLPNTDHTSTCNPLATLHTAATCDPAGEGAEGHSSGYLPGPPLSSGQHMEGRTNRGTGHVYNDLVQAPPRPFQAAPDLMGRDGSHRPAQNFRALWPRPSNPSCWLTSTACPGFYTCEDPAHARKLNI